MVAAMRDFLSAAIPSQVAAIVSAESVAFSRRGRYKVLGKRTCTNYKEKSGVYRRDQLLNRHNCPSNNRVVILTMCRIINGGVGAISYRSCDKWNALFYFGHTEVQ